MHLFRKKNIVDTICSLYLLTALSIIGADAQVNILGWNDATPKCDPLQAPTAPGKLQAVPGNQNMTLTWAFPSNGACVDHYNVTYYSVQPQGEVGTPVEVDTTSPNTTITGLINGVKYVFSVSAVTIKYNATAPATVGSIPHVPCDTKVTPGPPVNVTSFSQGSGIKVCWEGPQTGGCANEFRIASRIVPVTQAEIAASTWRLQEVPSAGCVFYNNLQDRRTYQFAVQSYSAGVPGGGYAGTQATVFSQWQCMPIPGYYPLCTAAATGQCNPSTCAYQVKTGKCSAPWLRQIDPTTKSIIQYCSDVCGCSIDSALAVPAAETSPIGSNTSSSQPAVFSMEGPASYESPTGCCQP